MLVFMIVSKSYSSKWWFDGDLPWDHGTIRKKSPNKQIQVTTVKRNEPHLSSCVSRVLRNSCFLTTY